MCGELVVLVRLITFALTHLTLSSKAGLGSLPAAFTRSVVLTLSGGQPFLSQIHFQGFALMALKQALKHI